MIEEVRLVETVTHGRVLVRRPADRPARIVLGFHGYAENAATHMARLEEIRGEHEDWMLVSVQGLHRFYQGRTETVVAGWMTREDRVQAIADNISYVDAVVRGLGADPAVPIFCAGFSQGVATAFRWGVRGAFACAGIIAGAGDVPPELLADAAAAFPPILLARGRADGWYTQERMAADVAALRSRGARLEVAVLDGEHEWSAGLSARASAFIAAGGDACARAASRLPPPSATS